MFCSGLKVSLCSPGVSPQRFQHKSGFKVPVHQKCNLAFWRRSLWKLSPVSKGSMAGALGRGLTSCRSLRLVILQGGQSSPSAWSSVVRFEISLSAPPSRSLKMSLLLQCVLLKDISLNGLFLTQGLLLSFEVFDHAPAIFCCGSMRLDLLVKLALKGASFSSLSQDLCCECLLPVFLYHFQVLMFFKKEYRLLDLL